MDRKTKLWLFSMKTCKLLFGCHQIPERSFFIGKYQFPICARCTGIFIGYIIGGITCIFIRLPFYYYIPLLFPMIFDGSLQLFTVYESNNVKRIITGLLAGIAYISLIIILIIWIVGLF